MPSSNRRLSGILFRYVIRETAFSFFIAFLFFFLIFFINQLLLMAEEILSKRVPLGQVLLLIFYSLPAIVAMAAPFASLVGTLMAIGRLSSDNEVLVILSSGLSYQTLYLPALAAGLVISLFSFIANDVLLPAGTIEFGRLYRKILMANPTLELEGNAVKRYKDTVIVTGDPQGTGLRDILIMDRTPNGERRLITAGHAEINEDARSLLTLDLSGAFIHSFKENSRDDYDYATSAKLSYSISQQDLIQSVGTPGPREMSSADVAREIAHKESALTAQLEERKLRLFRAAGLLQEALRAVDTSVLANRRRPLLEAFIRDRDALEKARKDRNLQIYRLEYYKKFSIPFGAASFVFLALPLGLFARKSGQAVGFGLGLIIAVLYWALLIAGQTMGVRLGYSPLLAMWLPNFSALLIGIILTALRIAR